MANVRQLAPVPRVLTPSFSSVGNTDLEESLLKLARTHIRRFRIFRVRVKPTNPGTLKSKTLAESARPVRKEPT